MRIHLATCIVAIVVALFGFVTIGVNTYQYLIPESQKIQSIETVQPPVSESE